MTKKHLFYGSLRSGQYNFNRFGPGTQKYIKTVKIPGFKMYNLGYYPCVTESDNLQDEITAELHEVNEEAAKKIYFMEKGAGYLSKHIEIDGEKAVIYYYTSEHLNRNNIIESGDWCG